MHKKAIIKSAIILTSANIITRVLGFFYRIYMSKTIGAEGMGLYQIITPLYLLIWAISSSGLSTTMSKLTAQEKAKGQQGNAEKILTISLIISVAIALCLSISVHNFAEEISQYIIKDKRTTLSLKWLSPCFPFMAAGSVIRGYFLGMQEAKVPAISQVIEQIVRMLAVYVLADTFVPMGLEYACGAAILGMALGEIISFLFTALNLFFVNHKLKPKVPTITTFTALSLITSMAIPLTLNRVASSIYATVENIILPQRLQLFGMSQSQSLSELGRLSGMAMPLVMFPSSLLTALATAILPVIAECYTLKNYNRITSTLKHSLLLTAIVACGTGGLFITYGYEIGQLIYSEKEIGSMLKLIGFICPFTYLQVTLSGVLNGLGEQLFIFEVNTISSLINLISIYFLVPIYGLNGFIFIWFITSIVVTTITLLRIKERTKTHFSVTLLFVKPILSITCACVIMLFISNHIFKITNNITILISLTIASVIYILLLFILKCLRKEDLTRF